MTVQELLNTLLEMPTDLEVILSKDEEGNGFGVLRVVEESHYVKEEYGGELTVLHPDDVDEFEDTLKAVVLWP